MIKGVDLSHFQGDIDWNKFKTEFAIIKCTQGVNFVDPKFADYKKHIRAKKIALGYYHFANGGDPIAEADFFLENVGDIAEGEVLALDFEIHIADPVGFCTKFVERIHDKVGFWPLFYLYSSLAALFKKGSVLNCGLWIADPSDPPRIGSWKIWAIWQYTVAAPGKQAGVPASCDQDYFNGTVAQFKKYGKPATFIAAGSTTVPKIELSEGTFFRYAHCDSLLVKEGDIVEIAQPIGTVGTGNGQWSAHLHFDKITKRLASWTNYVFGMTENDVKAIYADPTPDMKTVFPEFYHYGYKYLEFANYGTASAPKNCFHSGIDLNGKGAGNADLGDPIYSACYGKVVYAYNGADANGGWGKMIVVEQMEKPEFMQTLEATTELTPEQKVTVLESAVASQSQQLEIITQKHTDATALVEQLQTIIKSEIAKINWSMFISEKFKSLINLFKK